MLQDLWPIFGLSISTPRLELRVPTDDELVALAHNIVERRIHGPETIPFLGQWALAEPDEVPMGVAQHHWGLRASWTPESWNLGFVAFLDGEPVGSQNLIAKDFASLRSISSGSWLVTDLQGQGLGKEMRAAMLTLAFDHLGAVEALSSARVGNESSLRVSYAMGYEDNGQAQESFGGQVDIDQRLRLTPNRWQSHRPTYPIQVRGLAPCLTLFGI
jgi:RimJ/RimL family protein N-acetyltransferase